MATFGEIKADATRLADMRTNSDADVSGFVSTAELNAYANHELAELYDLLSNTFQDYFTTTALVNISSGNTVALPTGCFRILGVDYFDGADGYQSLRPFNFNARNDYEPYYSTNNGAYYDTYSTYRVIGNSLNILPRQDATGQYRIWYIPAYTNYTTDNDDIGNLGLNNWHQFATYGVAAKLMLKEETDPSLVLQMKEQVRARIKQAASFRQEPDRIFSYRFNDNGQY